ncbi:hypothetical protein [Modestobacter versicolor]|uniref:hypothetical protein n=1 Tax=Modestobacter versicolor TaxID=429133 RepID=UPI0034DE3014
MIDSARGWLLLLVAFHAALGWAVVVLAGSVALSGMAGSSVGWAAVLAWQLRTADARERRRVVRRSLREHDDPGPQWRPAVDAEVRRRLATTRREWWLLGALLGAVVGAPALACLVAAVPRDDWTAALPAVPLAAVGVLVHRWVRRLVAEARRWSDHPPVPDGA